MKVLLVEDDARLSAQLQEALAQTGYVVEVTNNGEEALYLGQNHAFDVVVLDLGLPRLDGLSVLRRWRAEAHDMPVLILTARDAWSEKVSGIDAGADDYLAKPFHMEELLARVRALIRRAGGRASSTLVSGEIELDTRSGRVSVAGIPVVLTAHELRVLDYFMHHPDRIITRTELTEHIYVQDFDRDSNTIEVFVARLRKKLPPGCIETVRGLGYRMAPGQAHVV